MALLLKESTDLLTTYHFHHYQSIPKVNQSEMYFHSKKFSSRQFSPIDHHESAAKILFNAMNWPKTIPAFTSLSNSDQVRMQFLSVQRSILLLLFSCYYWKKIGVIYSFLLLSKNNFNWIPRSYSLAVTIRNSIESIWRNSKTFAMNFNAWKSMRTNWFAWKVSFFFNHPSKISFTIFLRSIIYIIKHNFSWIPTYKNNIHSMNIDSSNISPWFRPFIRSVRQRSKRFSFGKPSANKLIWNN